MVYNPFTDPSSGFTNVVFVALFLRALIAIYNIMFVFHFDLIFDLKRCTNFSTCRYYSWFYITGKHFFHFFLKQLHGLLFYFDRVGQITTVSQVSLIQYSWKIYCRHRYYCYYYQYHLLHYYVLQIFAKKLD